jgi:hypothetical protein
MSHSTNVGFGGPPILLPNESVWMRPFLYRGAVPSFQSLLVGVGSNDEDTVASMLGTDGGSW